MRHIITLLSILVLISCDTDSNSYHLEGTANGFADGTMVFVNEVINNQGEVIDTIIISNEKFKASFPKSEAITIRYLQVENVNSTIVYFPENVDLNAVIYKDSIASSSITGSPQNESYQIFIKKLRSINNLKQSNMQRFQQARNEQDNMLAQQIQIENTRLTEQEKNLKQQFAIQNNNSIFSVMLMNEMLGRKEVDFAVAEQFVKSLSPKIAALPMVSSLKTIIANSKKAEVGSVAPDFSGPTPTDEIISLHEYLGKYTIIDFWASWCRPCRMENPNVVNVYNKYHDKGLNIISVSLDKAGQKDRWLKAIKDDKMDWTHISNLQFWNDPIAKMYNVRSIPATFLLDENGVIIDKNLRGPALETKIASLLGN